MTTPSDTAHPEGEMTRRKALKDMSPAELEHMELKAIADALAEAQRLLEGGAPAGRYSWLDAPVGLAAARASTPPSRPQGGRDIVTVIENLGAQEWRVQIGDILLFYGEDRADAIERATAVEQAILTALSNQGKPSS